MPLGTGGLHALWMTFLVGMTPVLELRGAIPLGVAAGLPPLTACAAAILGNLVPVPFIMLLSGASSAGCGGPPSSARRSTGWSAGPI